MVEVRAPASRETPALECRPVPAGIRLTGSRGSAPGRLAPRPPIPERQNAPTGTGRGVLTRGRRSERRGLLRDGRLAVGGLVLVDDALGGGDVQCLTGSGSSSGGGSWFEAMAQAWGQALDAQAGRIEDKSAQLSSGGDKPAEAPAKAEAEDVPEPTKRTSKKAAEPAPKKDFVDVLNTWATDDD